MSRPSSFTQVLCDDICTEISKGNSLNSICKKDEYPDISTVFKWLAHAESNPESSQYKEFFDKYLRAREMQADAIFDECLSIADDDSLDIGFTDEGKPFVRGENIQRAKLRVDTRMRMAGKLKPKKYGDKIAVSGDSENPLKHDHTIEIIHIKP